MQAHDEDEATVAVDRIRGYHAHVYYDADSQPRARALCEAASARFGVQMGRMHQRPVGPHPRWSCQLAFDPPAFAQVVPWLALNRDGLTVLVHPETGDARRDHVEHAVWMGEVLALELAALDD